MPLHQTTRRRVTLALFGALCLLPTMSVLGWIAARQLPGWSVGVSREWSSRLGLEVQIESVANPRPGIHVFSGVQVRDPESGQLLAEADRIEATHGGEGWVMVLTRPRLDPRRLPRLWQAMQQQFLASGPANEQSLQISASEVGMSAAGWPKITGLHASIKLAGMQPEAMLNFSLAGVEMQQPAQLRVRRDRNLQPPATRVDLHTGGGDWPALMLVPFLPWVTDAGDDCRFQGVIWTETLADGWQGEVSGRLKQIELGGLLAHRFPHVLTGRAELTLNRAIFSGGKIREAAGSFSAGPGVVSPSLLSSAALSLEMPALRGGFGNRESIGYQSLACGFTLSEAGIDLRGHADPALPGAVLVDASGVLLGEPRRRSLPVASLVQLLSTPSATQVPATREAEALLRVLPVK